MSPRHPTFAQAFGLAEAIEEAVTEAAKGASYIRPDLVALSILEARPDVEISPAELTLAVVEAATRAKVGLAVPCDEKSG